MARVDPYRSGGYRESTAAANLDKRVQPRLLPGDPWASAVLGSAPGEVLLTAGIYTLHSVLRLGAGRVLRGAGPATVLEIADPAALIQIAGDDAGLADLTIRSLLTTCEPSYYCVVAGVDYARFQAEGVRAVGVGAGMALEGNEARLAGCRIEATGPLGEDYPSVLVSGENSLVHGCHIEAPDGAAGYAILLDADSVKCLVTGCILTGSVQDDGTDNVQASNLNV